MRILILVGVLMTALSGCMGGSTDSSRTSDDLANPSDGLENELETE